MGSCRAGDSPAGKATQQQAGTRGMARGAFLVGEAKNGAIEWD